MEGPTPGLGAGPLGDDGRGGCVLGGSIFPGAFTRSFVGDCLHRLYYAAHRRHHRYHRNRHQACLGLLDHQPVGLHDARPRTRGLDGRDVPPLITHRFLQEPFVHVFWLRDPRRPHQRHDRNGWPSQENADHRLQRCW